MNFIRVKYCIGKKTGAVLRSSMILEKDTRDSSSKAIIMGMAGTFSRAEVCTKANFLMERVREKANFSTSTVINTRGNSSIIKKKAKVHSPTKTATST